MKMMSVSPILLGNTTCHVSTDIDFPFNAFLLQTNEGAFSCKIIHAIVWRTPRKEISVAVIIDGKKLTNENKLLKALLVVIIEFSYKT